MSGKIRFNTIILGKHLNVFWPDSYLANAKTNDMTTNADKLKLKLEKIRTDLKYYQQMTPEQYINDRVLFKIKLYYLLGKRDKLWYNLIAIFTIISGLLVPLFLNLDFKFSKEYATVLTLITGGLISLETVVFNFKEKFKSYKKTEDQLTNELILFQTMTEPYNIQSPTDDNSALFRLFVSRVESTILKERDETVEKMTRISLEQIKVNKI
jgi:Protein of unknown function (DUF4231)